jgi:hypothetical protein
MKKLLAALISLSLITPALQGIAGIQEPASRGEPKAQSIEQDKKPVTPKDSKTAPSTATPQHSKPKNFSGPQPTPPGNKKVETPK